MNANQELTVPFELDAPVAEDLWILCADPTTKTGICTVFGLQDRFVVCFQSESIATEVERNLADDGGAHIPVASTFEELRTQAVGEGSDVAGIALFGEDLREISRRYWA